VRELDKAAMGRRIRQIRLGAGLRQWELARKLGTTQSAVHKYEHGVVPEPRRLVELARVGGTSIEWVLTGQHWENGSENQDRLDPEILETACALREIGQDERATVNEALRIIREAVRVLDATKDREPTGNLGAVSASLREHAEETRGLLEAAWRIQCSVLKRVAEEAARRMRESQSHATGGDSDRESAAGGG
jgi:transcriptional regulator with XRE-family HTH domain